MMLQVPSKGAPEADQSQDRTAAGKVLNTKTITSFFQHHVLHKGDLPVY